METIKPRRSLVYAGLISGALILSACGGDNQESSSETTVAPRPYSGDRVTFADDVIENNIVWACDGTNLVINREQSGGEVEVITDAPGCNDAPEQEDTARITFNDGRSGNNVVATCVRGVRVYSDEFPESGTGDSGSYVVLVNTAGQCDQPPQLG